MDINYTFLEELAKNISEVLNTDVTLKEDDTIFFLPKDVNILKIPVFVFLKFAEEYQDEFKALDALDKLNIIVDYQGTGKTAVFFN